MPLVDLHTHTHFSDGTSSPEEVVQAALKRGVQLFSLTDHDTTDGTARAAAVCQEHGLKFVYGVEISTGEYDQLHFTGYNIDITNTQFQSFLAQNRQDRKNRILKVVTQLQQAGVNLTSQEVFSCAANTISRVHVADALTQKKIAHNRQDAFKRFLVQGKPGYVAPIGASAVQAIAQIKKAGGLAVIAHPGIVSDHWDFPKWVEAGLDGIEVFYPAHGNGMRQDLLSLARKYGLFATAGSDYHGPRGGRVIAPGINLPQDHYNRLLNKLFG